jgi:hypothetical protein
MPSSPLRRARLSAALALTAGMVVSLTAAPSLSPAAVAAAPAKSGIYLGAAGDGEAARSRTGEQLADHAYGYFERNVPTGRMISVRFQNFQAWRTTANLSSGSTSHKQIASWADTIKARGGEIFIAFHHEPESTGSKKFGTAEEYKAAYRKVTDIFRARGANNAIFTWQMTAYAFRADSGAYNAAAKWYPGDGYVDVVGADPYNWYTCGHGLGRWQSLRTLVDPVLSFARARGKQVALAEFASVRDARRPAWIKEAGDYMAANDDVIAAAFYFNRAPTNSANSDCTWTLTSDADYAALREVARRSMFKH